MAFNDALFQLGMDLTRSSPAHEEDFAVVARTGRADCGTEYIPTLPLKSVAIDLVGASGLATPRAVERAVARALAFARANVTSSNLKRQVRTGAITGTVSFTGGRVAVEVWPAGNYVAIDVQGSMRPELALTAFADAFSAREAVLKRQRLAGDGARFKVPTTQAALTTRKAA